jgi:5-methylthioadenosine/S-adenosylhomocysteine deaminase
MEPLLLEHAFILTCDGKNSVIKDGALQAEGDRITYVGPYEEIGDKKARGANRIDAKGSLVLPGLIDTHIHLAQALLRGLVPDDLGLIDWLKDWVWPLQGVYDGEDGRVSSELCILEMLETGTTTFLESGLHTRYGFNGIAEVVKKSGIRGVLSKMVMDLPGYASKSSILDPGMIEDGEKCISEFLAMHKKWNKSAGGRIRVWIGARTPGACTESLYRQAAEIVTKMNSGFTMHLAEIRDDIKYFQKMKTTPSNFANKVGILKPKPVFAHGVWLTEKDADVFAKHGATVSHCPSSNLKLGSGIAPVPMFLEKGLNVSLGCDGGPSNDCYDMVRETKLVATIHRGFLQNPSILTSMEAIRLATTNGAKALKLEKEIGSLEEGKKADFIVMGSENTHTYPRINPISNYVYSSTGHDVSMVVVNGKVVVENGVVLTLNKERILKDAERCAMKVLERSGKGKNY